MFKLINNRSKKLFEQAQKVIPGGVNSPVRAFKSVGAVSYTHLTLPTNREV